MCKPARMGNDFNRQIRHDMITLFILSLPRHRWQNHLNSADPQTEMTFLMNTIWLHRASVILPGWRGFKDPGVWAPGRNGKSALYISVDLEKQMGKIIQKSFCFFCHTFQHPQKRCISNVRSFAILPGLASERSFLITTFIYIDIFGIYLKHVLDKLQGIWSVEGLSNGTNTRA